MIIEENMLRPPSPKEMEARYVPLERLRFVYESACWTDPKDLVDHYDVRGSCSCAETVGHADTLSNDFTTLELIEFHKTYGIPYEAFLVNNGYEGEKALAWTHLKFCEECKRYYDGTQEHETGPLTVHDYLIRSREIAMEDAAQQSRARRGLQ